MLVMMEVVCIRITLMSSVYGLQERGSNGGGLDINELTTILP